MLTAPTPLTMMFWPESAYGPTNQCIGLAAILRDRGHTIVFTAESQLWPATVSAFERASLLALDAPNLRQQ